MSLQSANSLVQRIFFANYFCGICAIGLSIEASLQQSFPLNSLFYYATLFAVTVLYYTIAYIQETSADTTNLRLLWYRQHRKFVMRSQVAMSLIILAFVVYVLQGNFSRFIQMPLRQWLLIFIFPLIAIAYYGLGSKTLGGYNLRNVGWLKPFVIGFVWAGLVTIYPVLFYDITNNVAYQFTFIGSLLFLKNFMFVTVLGIMFDIKDYAMDYNKELKTFVVKVGLRSTIFFILIPLCMLGFGTFLTYGFTHHFSVIKMLLNTIPFIALITVAFSMKQRRPILYYLIIIDGLLLVKAVCGSVAMVWF